MKSFNGMPAIGKKAPQFTASTTHGKINFPVDYKNKWTILFSHPTNAISDFIEIGKHSKELSELNCHLIGLASGKRYTQINFPLIEDDDKKISEMYGMIQTNDSLVSSVREVIFIDPQGIIQSIIYSPVVNGIDFDEVKRTLVGLQAVDSFGVALPNDWFPGEEVVIHKLSPYQLCEKRNNLFLN